MSEEIEDEKKSVEVEEETKVETETEDGSSQKKDDFEKENEVVPASKYNQAVRKQREMELEKRELEKKIAEMSSTTVEKEDEEDDEDLFEDDEEEKKPKAEDPSKLIDEKMKPVLEAMKKRDESDKKAYRTAFFEAHPQYLTDSEKWQELLDEVDRSINPNSGDDYYTQLEKGHRILSGDSVNIEIEEKKREIAADAGSGSNGAEKTIIEDEFTAEDKNHMKMFGVSEEGMRAYKKKIASGSMTIM